MKKKIGSLLFAFLMVGSLAAPAYACDADVASFGQEEESLSGIATHADEIVYRLRIYEGRFQYRRWNKTKACWVDPDWIDGHP